MDMATLLKRRRFNATGCGSMAGRHSTMKLHRGNLYESVRGALFTHRNGIFLRHSTSSSIEQILVAVKSYFCSSGDVWC